MSALQILLTTSTEVRSPVFQYKGESTDVQGRSTNIAERRNEKDVTVLEGQLAVSLVVVEAL